MTKDELREQVRELVRDLWSEAWQEGESAANSFSWGCSAGVSEKDENVSEATDAILALFDQAQAVPLEPSEEAIKSARKATALHASIRPKLRSIEDREKLERELLKVGISAAYAIDALEQNDE